MEQVPLNSGFLHMAGSSREDSDFGQLKEETPYANQLVFHLQKSEGTIDHLGLHCDAATLRASIFHSFRMPQRVAVELLAVWGGNPSGL